MFSALPVAILAWVRASTSGLTRTEISMVQSFDVAIADRLIHAGAHVNAQNELRVTPLLLACTNGSAAMVTIQPHRYTPRSRPSCGSRLVRSSMSGRDLDSNRSQSQAGASEWSPRGVCGRPTANDGLISGSAVLCEPDLARH